MLVYRIVWACVRFQRFPCEDGAVLNGDMQFFNEHVLSAGRFDRLRADRIRSSDLELEGAPKSRTSPGQKGRRSVVLLVVSPPCVCFSYQGSWKDATLHIAGYKYEGRVYAHLACCRQVDWVYSYLSCSCDRNLRLTL